jgi:hypothetical protein
MKGKSSGKSAIQTVLDNLGEDIFTQTVIKPLFHAMGYEWSGFNGGPYELGVDLIAFKEDPLKNGYHVACIQSKKIGENQKTLPKNKLSEIINQLRQCLMDEQILPNGVKQRANDVYLAIPGTLNPRLRREIDGQLNYGKKVNVLEGPQIISLLERFCPDVLENLSNHPSFVVENNDVLFGNIPLQEALFSNDKKNLTDYVCDLQFFIGQKREKALITCGFDNLFDAISCDLKELDLLICMQDKLADICETKFTQQNFYEKKSKYIDDHELFDSKANQELQQQIKSSKDSLVEFSNTLIDFVEDAQYSGEISKTEASNLIKELQTTHVELNHTRAWPKEYDNKIKHPKSVHSDLSKRIKSIQSLTLNFMPKPDIKVLLNKAFVKNELIERGNHHLNFVKKIEAGQADKHLMFLFLNNAETLLKIQSTMFHSTSPFYAILEKSKIKTEENRISFPPSIIFDTKKDIALYGGAGFGKTTTLQSYAIKCKSNPATNCIFIELAKNKDVFKKHLTKPVSGKLQQNALIKCILEANKIDISDFNIRETKRIIQETPILLDGVDEVYSYVKNIIPAIKLFKKENPKSQIIITSRDNTAYLADIDFLSISLLPFTEEQLESFIVGWCKSKEVANQLIKTIRNKKLQGIVSNPLLATIACSLTEKGVRIPNSECKLYEERFNLLTGKYDNYKGVNRQSNPPETLQEIAKCCAFIFHENQVRSMDYQSVLQKVIRALNSRYKKRAIISAIGELINPCNILILDDVKDSVSFGHFRYQESLVAQQLEKKQTPELIRLLSITFWQGAFTLFAEKNSVETLLDECIRINYSNAEVETTLAAMISNSPVPIEAKRGYRELLEMMGGGYI